jgi:alanine racemase
VEISARRLAGNYRLLGDTAGNHVAVLAVVKADAYGHGAELCAPVLAAAGADWLGVTDAAEGRIVRNALARAGISPEQQPRVLVMSEALDEDADATVENDLTPVVSNIEQVEALSRAVQSRAILAVDAKSRASHPFAVHLELDTGMARQGVAAGDALDTVLGWFSRQNTLSLDGVMTHFASAEIAGSHQTTGQRKRFEQAIRQVAAAGLSPAWVHAGNSSTVDVLTEGDAAEASLCWLQQVAHTIGARAMVRSGLGLYGYSLPVEREQGYTGVAESQVRSRLKLVMAWKTRVTGVREVEPGTRIGYNGTFTAIQTMRLALLPIGYADGLRRELSGSNVRPAGWVMFGDHRAPILGRVSMNLTIVDVTGVPSVAVGDEAVVLGEGVTADDHAQLAATIPYEILCGIKAPRVLV